MNHFSTGKRKMKHCINICFHIKHIKYCWDLTWKQGLNSRGISQCEMTTGIGEVEGLYLKIMNSGVKALQTLIGAPRLQKEHPGTTFSRALGILMSPCYHQSFCLEVCGRWKPNSPSHVRSLTWIGTPSFMSKTVLVIVGWRLCSASHGWFSVSHRNWRTMYAFMLFFLKALLVLIDSEDTEWSKFVIPIDLSSQS